MGEKREIEIALKSRSAEISADKLIGKVKGIGQSADNADAAFLDLKKSIDKLSAGVATISKLDKSVDGLSASIQQSNAQMAKGTAATSKLDGNIDELNKSVLSTDNSMDQLNQSLSKNALTTSSANTKTKAFDSSMKSMDSTVERSALSMDKLSIVASAVAAALATSQIQKYADSWTNVNNRLHAATATNEEFLIAQQGVVSIAQEAGVSIEGVADSYSRLAQATSELGVSQERVLTVTRNVALALKAGGATAQEVSSIAVQLGQGLGAGALQGDELRSILESSIPIAKALAKEFDTTTGELKKLGAEGKLTSERVVAALENMDRKSLTFTKDITSGLTEVSNALTVYVGGVDESLGVTESLTGSLSSLASNIDVIIEGATTLAVIIGARYAGALGVAAASQVALTAASLKGTTTMNAFGVVTARTTVAMNASALAARGLSSAMALIGGPVGLAVIAAAALYSFASSGDEASEKTKTLSVDIENLTEKFKFLSAVKIKDKLLDVGYALKAQKEEVERLDASLKVSKGAINKWAKVYGDDLDGLALKTKDYKEQVIRAEAEKETATKKYNETLKLQGQLVNQIAFLDGGGKPDVAPLSGGKPKPPVDTSTDDAAFESLLARLERETSVIQSELEVRRMLEDGVLTEREARHALDMQAIFFRFEEKRIAIEENTKLGAERQAELIAEIDAQQLAAEELKQSQLTGIAQDGANDRKAALSQQLGDFQRYSNTAFAVAGLFGAKSEKQRKKFAKGQIIINTAIGITRAFSDLGWPAGIPAAIMAAATGVSQLAAIGSSGGNPAPSSVATSSPTQAALPPPVSNQQTQRTINIVGLENFGPDDMLPVTKSQFIEYMSSDEDVNVAINSGQQSAVRVGAI